MKELRLIESFRNISDKVIGDNSAIVCGIGDDTAVLESADKDKYVLWTKDSLVEGIHFKCSDISFYDIGRKAMAVNLSDIAAMGGLPKYALVSVSAPASVLEDDLIELYKGMSAIGEKFGVVIVGGDTTGAENNIFISVSVMGEVQKEHLKLRKNAKVGDLIFVTGFLGGSILEKHYSFEPRVKVAQVLNAFNVSSMMDISDGLGSDIFKLAKASKCGIMLDSDCLPIADDVLKRSKSNLESINSALYDGEDFELLFTASKVDADKIKLAVKENTGVDVAVVGEIRPFEEGCNIKMGSKTVLLKDKGFDHFG